MKRLLILAVLAVGCGSDDDGSATEVGGAADRKIVFVTADTFTGNLGGDSAADIICQDRAQAAGLAGTYRAWLSGAAGPAGQKVADNRYVRVDGALVAESQADLLDGSIANLINLDASGQARGGDVWTGTLSDGQGSSSCQQWTVGDSRATGVCGSTGFVNARWTDNLVPACGVSLRLFCFEQ